MEFFRIRRDIPFMRHALAFNVVSLVTFLLAVVFLATMGLNLGVDFKGGTVIEVTYGHPVDFNRVRTAIDKLSLGEFSVQSFGRSDTALCFDFDVGFIVFLVVGVNGVGKTTTIAKLAQRWTSEGKKVKVPPGTPAHT